jgi:hypothetical protein
LRNEAEATVSILNHRHGYLERLLIGHGDNVYEGAKDNCHGSSLDQGRRVAVS